MTIGYQCIKGHRGRFLEIRPLYRYAPHSFLWWPWLARHVDGYLVRCVHHGCGRAMVVSLDGVEEPADVAPQPVSAPQEPDAEREQAPPPPPLGLAVRRPRVGA